MLELGVTLCCPYHRCPWDPCHDGLSQGLEIGNNLVLLLKMNLIWVKSDVLKNGIHRCDRLICMPLPWLVLLWTVSWTVHCEPFCWLLFKVCVLHFYCRIISHALDSVTDDQIELFHLQVHTGWNCPLISFASIGQSNCQIKLPSRSAIDGFCQDIIINNSAIRLQTDFDILGQRSKWQLESQFILCLQYRLSARASDLIRLKGLLLVARQNRYDHVFLYRSQAHDMVWTLHRTRYEIFPSIQAVCFSTNFIANFVLWNVKKECIEY